MPNAIPKLNEPIGVFKSPSFLLVVTPFLPKKASVSNIFLSSSKYSKIPFDSSTTLTFINCIFTSIWLCFGIPPVFTNLLHVFYLKPFPSTSLAFNIIMNASLSIFFAMFCIA